MRLLFVKNITTQDSKYSLDINNNNETSIYILKNDGEKVNLEEGQQFRFYLNKNEVINVLIETFNYSIDKSIYLKNRAFKFNYVFIKKAINLLNTLPELFEYETNVSINQNRFYLKGLRQDNGFSLRDFLVGGIHCLQFFETADNKFYCRISIDEMSVDVLEYFKQFEIISQTNEVSINIIKPKYFDIERAKLNFQLTGQKGEELIAEYLDKQKTHGIINDFNWVNQSRESSFPYDFQIFNNDGSEIFTDVKTTAFDFDQKLIVSTNEFNFINQNPTNYHIYRVYNLNNNEPSLRICRNINQIGEHIINHTNQLTTNLSTFSTTIQSLKFAIQPNNHILNFDDPITL